MDRSPIARRSPLPVLAALLLAPPVLTPPVLADPPPAASSGLISLSRTERHMEGTGDPVWELALLIPGQPTRRFDALVGRAARQAADRDKLGSQAPLPKGRYRISEVSAIETGDNPELGRLHWIGLEPQFATARRGLGIHHDPSAGLGRRSGTDGCIGLIQGNDLVTLVDLVRRSGMRELEVRD
ncbi:L,D-transpeptidase [Vulcanococcus limneticus]|uniref:L,D-transpeptidase n=1 Tax=Vulcanococcus limneticus TaxID=2170428 RepID=UPI00398BFF37